MGRCYFLACTRNIMTLFACRQTDKQTTVTL